MWDYTNLVVPLLIFIGAGLGYRQQQKKQQELIQSLQEAKLENADKQHLINTQMHDITQQMVMQASMKERMDQVNQQLIRAQSSLSQKDTEIKQTQQQYSLAQAQISQLETQLQADKKSTEEKLQLLLEAKETMRHQFQVLAQQIFEEKGKLLQQENSRGLNEILNPMREQLQGFRQRVDEIYTDETKERASLREHLNQLQLLNKKMSADAIHLTHALKGESKVQGNWGEMILQRILETSGLREGHEFVREQSFTVADGKRLRPDVIINMPGDKHIIIDSKVSLTDYERVTSSLDNQEKSNALKAHLRSLKSHILSLSSKRYEHLPDIHSPDYVLMFIPIEGAYLMAIEADSAMFEDAFEKHVAVVTPSTLYATLKLIEQLWRYERQSENVAKLIERASKLHDKFADFTHSFEDIGNRLKQAQQAYDTSLNRMTTGTGNVMRQINQLGTIAGKTKKELPAHLLAETEHPTPNLNSIP